MEVAAKLYFVIVLLLAYMSIHEFGSLPQTPAQFCEGRDINLIAGILLWIIWVMFNPIYYIVSFFNWLFHIKL